MISCKCASCSFLLPVPKPTLTVMSLRDFQSRGSTATAYSLGPQVTQTVSATTYIVVAGDTIWSIAQHFGVTLQRLIDANPTIVPDVL